MLRTIQAGRGLAALAVVMFHLSIAMGDPRYGGTPVFRDATWRGNLGVDFFFVLSGFIMMLIHEKDIGKPSRWRKFAHARFSRLYPIYWLYSAVFCLLVAFGFGTVTQLPSSLGDWISTISLVRLSDVTAPLAVAWTLFHEIAFYGVFSILILNKRAGLLVFFAWMLATALAFNYPPTDNPSPIQTYLAAFNLDFMIGIASCLIMQRTSAVICNACFSIGSALLVLTIGYEYGIDRLPWSGIAYGVAFGGIIAGMAAWERRRGGVKIPLAEQLGDASYTTYLIHVPIIGVCLKLAAKLHIADAIPGEAIYIGTLLAVVCSTYAVHKIVERPLQSWMKHISKAKHLQAAATV